jgi:DNA-binding NarL/FixJ family response regulator
MPGLDGSRITQMIKNACPQVKVIALTRHDEAGFVRRMLDAGAMGYVLKQSALSEVTRAVRAVAAGRQFVDASIRGAISPSPAEAAHAARPAAPEVPLSLQEQTVLRLVASAHTYQEIAASLSIDMAQVLATRMSAMTKAGLATRTDVVRYAHARGWLCSN